MSNSMVLIDLDDRGVATVTFNRPEVNNAYNGDMIQALLSGMTKLASDKQVRLIVIKGNGRHFQAGADLNWISKVSNFSYKENLTVSEETANAIMCIDNCPKPTLALVHGGCFGGGTGIIASCDIVIASSDALFSISEVRWGLHAGPILPQLIVAMGAQNLRRFALTGERFNALEAQKLGLINEVCGEGELEKTAQPIVDAILQNAPNSISDTKRIIMKIIGSSFDKNFYMSLVRDHASKRLTDEASEGLASFREKRDANWYSRKG